MQLMAKIQTLILILVTVVVFAYIVRGTISPGKFKKFAQEKGTVGVIGQEWKTENQRFSVHKGNFKYVIIILISEKTL